MCFHHVLFFFDLPAPTGISTLSLHDALLISSARRIPKSAARPSPSWPSGAGRPPRSSPPSPTAWAPARAARDRKSTRLNSSHVAISYAVFCLKKKKKNTKQRRRNTNQHKLHT